MALPPLQALQAIQTEARQAIQASVQELLETKHLYQSARVDIETIRERHAPSFQSPPAHSFLKHVAGISKWLWKIDEEDQHEDLIERLSQPFVSSLPDEILWSPPDIKIFCAKCRRDEPFNLDCTQNLLPTAKQTRCTTDSDHFESSNRVQVFSLSYLCQSCKSIPEFFLVRRVGPKLVLSGRSPMEAVVTPKAIPPRISSYYSAAQIAFQSGQVLASLFMLRTACEQWVRPFAGQEDKADVALEKYAQTLPDDFRARFPSLKSTYSDLSAAIHSADANPDLFLKQQEAISTHFEARALFKLTDAASVSSEPRR